MTEPLDLDTILDEYCGPNRTNLPVVERLVVELREARAQRAAALSPGTWADRHRVEAERDELRTQLAYRDRAICGFEVEVETVEAERDVLQARIDRMDALTSEDDVRAAVNILQAQLAAESGRLMQWQSDFAHVADQRDALQARITAALAIAPITELQEVEDRYAVGWNHCRTFTRRVLEGNPDD